LTKEIGMTEETESLVLALLREIRQEQGEMSGRIAGLEQKADALEQKVDLCATRDEMNLRFDQIADLMTVFASSQGDVMRRIEDLESA